MSELFAGHWTFPELAKKIGKTERTLYRWSSLPSNPLPYTEVGNVRLVNPSVWDAWILQGGTRQKQHGGRRRPRK